jgi:hypothetical protein
MMQKGRERFFTNEVTLDTRRRRGKEKPYIVIHEDGHHVELETLESAQERGDDLN